MGFDIVSYDSIWKLSTQLNYLIIQNSIFRTKIDIPLEIERNSDMNVDRIYILMQAICLAVACFILLQWTKLNTFQPEHISIFRRQTLKWHQLKLRTRFLHCSLLIHMVFFSMSVFLAGWRVYGLGEVIYTTATTKPSAMPTNSLLRSSLSVNSRHHHQRTASGMTSSSSATSSNSNNLNNERHRDNSRSSELQKTGGNGTTFTDSRDDDSSKDDFQTQNGKITFSLLFCLALCLCGRKGFCRLHVDNLVALQCKWTRIDSDLHLNYNIKTIKVSNHLPLIHLNFGHTKKREKNMAFSSWKMSVSN